MPNEAPANYLFRPGIFTYFAPAWVQGR